MNGFHFRYKARSPQTRDAAGSPCSVGSLLLQLLASPTQGAGVPTCWLPAPYLSCGSLEGVPPTLSTSEEDAGAGLGALGMAFSSLFTMAPEKAGSSVEDFSSAKNRGKT